MSEHLLIGQTLAFAGDPFREGWDAVVRHSSRGGVLVRDGVIAAVGEADDLRAAHPGVAVTDYGSGLISAGLWTRICITRRQGSSRPGASG